MPAGRPEAAGSSGAGAGGGQRSNFRPPWVKEGPQPIPMPTAPWAHANRSKDAGQPTAVQPEANDSRAGPPARKTSSVKIVPLQPSENGTPRDPHTFQVPKLREVHRPEPTKLQSKEIKVPVTLTSRPKEQPIQVHIETKKSVPEVEREPPRQARERVPEERKPPLQEIRKEPEIDKATASKRNDMVRQESMKKIGGQSAPAPPPMPPPPPPPPAAPKLPDQINLTAQQLEKIEQLRARPRRRPDWGAMMKELECGKKLKKVHCNDRSQPLLPQVKAKEQFIYESEKSNIHNQLLRQIQTGANLKHVKTNDRSRPILEGLRKFRRQMTIEEQIQKSQSIANMAEPEVEEEVDEMDDIDKIRDDLQSTKQMLALELRNKEAQIRENKRLQARLLNLEAELLKEKSMIRSAAEVNSDDNSGHGTGDDKVVQTLKDEATEARKTAEELEKKYHDAADQLDNVKGNLEEAKRQNQLLEKKLQAALQGGDMTKRQSIIDRRESVLPAKEPEETESEPESETESDSDESDNEEKAQRRAEREIRLLKNKLHSYKNKEEAARRERKSLREQMKKNQQAIKKEKKKYHELQREVNKMAALMRDDEEDEEAEEKEEAEEEEAESEESESESESETSEEEESSASEAEDSPLETKKTNLTSRSKRHENCLNALKKGNYMLKANVDRLQDDLNKQKEEVLSLQEDLNSVLAELG